jgi:hypothetical protein
LELYVGSHMFFNTSAPQVGDPSPSSPKVIWHEKSAKGDLDSNHTPTSTYNVQDP